MTRDDIDKMEAGPEMDELVAKIMGVWQPPPGENEDALDAIARCWGSRPPYSTSIAAAWRLVEKMLADGWSYQARDRVGKQFFRLSIHNAFDELAESESLPLSICRAALKASLAK